MSRLRDVASFCAVGCLWGLSLAAVEVGLRSFPPLLLSAFRYYAASVLLLGYAATGARDWLPRTRGDVVAIVGGGVGWIAIGNGVWFVGQALTTSVLSGLMTSLTPVATTAVSWLALPDDRLSPVSLAGLFISFGGAVLLVSPSGPVAVTTALLGKALLLLGVLGLAFGSVLVRWASTSLPSTARTGWATLVGAAVIHGLSVLAAEQWTVAEATPLGVAAVGYLAVGATAVAYVLFFGLLDRHPAIEVTLVTYVVPVVAAVTGWILFDEQLSWQMAVGFLVIVVGFVVMKRRELRAELERLRFEEAT